MNKHFLDDEVQKVSLAPVINFYGGIHLVKKGKSYYLAKPHWHEGLVAEKVSSKFAKAFISEFGENK